MKAIEYRVMENGQQTEVFRSVSILTKKIEPAGHAFGKLI
jgi:hypothetical protein